MKTTLILGTIFGLSVFVGHIGWIVPLLVLGGMFAMWCSLSLIRQVIADMMLQGGWTQLGFTIVMMVIIAMLLVQLASELHW